MLTGHDDRSSDRRPAWLRVRREPLPMPGNDNALQRVRPLTYDDLQILINEFGPQAGSQLDTAAATAPEERSLFRLAMTTMLHLPALQRAIVWRGSWVKWDDLDNLHQGESLVYACVEVIVATKAAYHTEDIIIDGVRPFSKYLQKVFS